MNVFAMIPVGIEPWPPGIFVCVLGGLLLLVVLLFLWDFFT